MSEGRYGIYSKGYCGWTSFRKEELQEEEVWGTLFHKNDKFTLPKVKISSPSTTLRYISTAAKMIPRSNNNAYNKDPKMAPKSAPVTIPDWSKIYGINNCTQQSSRTGWESDEEEDDDENGGMVMPPHEWLARKHARNNQMNSFSVCEGVGRTLKGRDITRVRNSVLTKTGFLE